MRNVMILAISLAAATWSCRPVVSVQQSPGLAPAPGAEAEAEPEAEPAAPRHWATFMGDASRAGNIAGTPVTRPRVRWKRFVGVPGYLNNPVVHGDTVVIGSSGYRWNSPDRADGVYAFDIPTGRRRWFRRTRRDVNGVTIAAGLVLAGTDGGRLVALELETGALRWTYQARGAIYGSPLVLGSSAFVADAGGLVTALYLGSGRTRWKRRFRSGFRGALASDGIHVFGATTAGEVLALDPDTGRPVWRVKLSTLVTGLARKSVYATPVVAGEMVFIGYVRDTSYADPPLLALDASTGALRWQARWNRRPRRATSGNLRATVAYADGTLYFSLPYGQRVFALDARTGMIQWTRRVGACYFTHWSSATVGGGLIYQPRFDSRIYAFEPSGQLAWAYRLGPRPGPFRAMAQIAGPSSGRCQWRPRRGNRQYSSAAYHRTGMLFIANGSGYLFALSSAP